MSGKSFALLLAGALIMPIRVHAQRNADTDAINRIIDQYAALEDAMDMPGQARLMTADRVWIGPGAGRRTNQEMNMRSQQAAYDALKKQAPGLQTFTDLQDRLIKFHGNGTVAVASFYRYTTVVAPPNAPPEVVRNAPQPVAITLVLEKRDGDWKIVHTHVSTLTQADNRQ